MLRPPPKRRASASGMARTLPRTTIPAARSQLRIGVTSEPTIVSNADAAMDCNHTGGEVKHFYLRQPGLAQHLRQHRLIGMLTDGIGQVAVGAGVAGHPVAQPRQYLERIPVVGALERLPDLREFEHHQTPARL